MDDYSWIGPLIGAVGGYFGSQGGNTTTQQQSVPPELQQLLSGVSQRGMEIGNMPYQPYTGNRVADFNPYQFQGMDSIAAAANGQQPMLGAAQSSLQDTLSGKYLNGNPYLDAMVNKTAGDVQGRMNTGAFSSGSFGNAGVAQAGAQGIADAENQLRYGSYNDERNRMNNALGYVPSVANAQYIPGTQLSNIGATMQQQGQNVLNADYEQYQNAQQWPFQTYNAMLAPFGRNIGSTQTTTGPQQNPVAGMLGGALLGGRIQQGWNSSGTSGWNTTGQS